MTTTDVVGELDGRFSAPDATATSWADVRGLLEDTELFWISTVRADSRPHVTPLPAVWRDNAIYFCTGAGEQKGVNLRNNASCALTTGNKEWKSGLDVVIEGVATRVVDQGHLEELARAWESKYRGDWHFEVDDGAFHHEGGAAHVFEVVPVKILAFAKGDFAQTRFTFPSDS
jgi:nitroimidazol reductase NimA-like FMN-containing flavoprotein (pyridoxamine 5'-phosphate oxidase superfamily)